MTFAKCAPSHLFSISRARMRSREKEINGQCQKGSGDIHTLVTKLVNFNGKSNFLASENGKATLEDVTTKMCAVEYILGELRGHFTHNLKLHVDALRFNISVPISSNSFSILAILLTTNTFDNVNFIITTRFFMTTGANGGCDLAYEQRLGKKKCSPCFL